MAEIYSGSWQFYREYKKRLAAGEILSVGHSFRLSMLTASYVPDLINHKNWSDISSTEIVGSGYTAGGVLINTTTLNSIDNYVKWGANIVEVGPFVDLTTVMYAVIYDDSHADDALVAYCLMSSLGEPVEGYKFNVFLSEGICKYI